MCVCVYILYIYIRIARNGIVVRGTKQKRRTFSADYRSAVAAAASAQRYIHACEYIASTLFKRASRGSYVRCTRWQLEGTKGG